MIPQTVIVYGPQASGKTRNKEALMAKFGCTHVVDEWAVHRMSALTPGALHLTTKETFSGKFLDVPGGVLVVSIRYALKGIPQ